MSVLMLGCHVEEVSGGDGLRDLLAHRRFLLPSPSDRDASGVHARRRHARETPPVDVDLGECFTFSKL